MFQIVQTYPNGKSIKVIDYNSKSIVDSNFYSFGLATPSELFESARGLFVDGFEESD